MNQKQKKALLQIIIAAALLVLLAFLPTDRFAGGWLTFFLYMIPYLVVGYDILRRAVLNISHGQVFDENFLMAVATVGAIALGEYREGVAVMLFYQIGELFQSYAVGKSRRNIAELMDIRPDYANLVTKEGVETVDPDDVEVGSVILVKPGEKIPVDGVVVEGESTLDTAVLTGESRPRKAVPGDAVLSGCINQSGVLRIETTAEFDESTASKILDLVENASSRKSRSENFISKFAKYYTPIVCYSALALFLLPPLVRLLFLHLSPEWGRYLYRALTFLVISCPCALVISIPLSFFAGLGGASSRGILIKGSNFLETLSQVKTVAFDKTGTVTKGNFAVTEIKLLEDGGGPLRGQQVKTGAERSENTGATENGLHNEKAPSVTFDLNSADELLFYAAHLESYSTHPIAESLRNAYEKSGSVSIDRSIVSDIEEIGGHGLTGLVNGHRVAVGNRRLMDTPGILSKDIERKAADGDDRALPENGTLVYVALDGRLLGYAVIADEIKPTAAAAMQALKMAGVTRTVMLTGDSPAVASSVSKEVGISEVCAGLLPEDKVARVEALLSEIASSAGSSAAGDRANSLTEAGKDQREVSEKESDRAFARRPKLAFVGDGINDAPVLSRADIGIAMGALGSDAAIEAADVVLMDDDPLKIAQAIRIAKKCMRIVYENIYFAIGIKLFCLLLGALGVANMWVAIFADVGVMVLAVLNAMRTMLVKKL